MIETGSIEKIAYDITELRSRFPILGREVNGYPLVYLDNAATTQKPSSVIDSLSAYYKGYNSNIHRGVHTLANEATEAFEKTRKSASEFINAGEKEVVITKGTTEGINLVARTWGEANIKEGDRILVGAAEHHSNIVPWQILAEKVGAAVEPIPLSQEGILDREAFKSMLDESVRLVAINFISNSLGTINPINDLISDAHHNGSIVLVDAAQAAPHIEIDVKAIDCDFLAFSGHKMFGPTGVGFLYGKYDLLDQMPPFIGGGEMIDQVSFNGTSFLTPPLKFEAGTPNIADVIAMDQAFGFVSDIGFDAINKAEKEIVDYSRSRMSKIQGLKEYGTAEEKIAVFSFNLEGIHPFDVGQLLDAKGIAVRTGHHCTMPMMSDLGIEGTVRASFAVYNSMEETEKLWDNVERIQKKYGSS